MSDDGGRIISPEVEKAIHEHLTKSNPVFDAWRESLPPLPPLTRRQRLRRRWQDFRWALADRIGGGRHYTEGCDR